MKKSIIWICAFSICFAFSIMSAYASELIYWTGTKCEYTKSNATDEKQPAPPNNRLFAWEFGSNAFTAFDDYGFLIEENVEGVYLVRAADSMSKVDLAHYADGQLQNVFTINMPEPVDPDNVYALYNDWIYYGYNDGEDVMGVRRYNISTGTLESVNLSRWIDTLHYSILSISEDGAIAFVGKEQEEKAWDWMEDDISSSELFIFEPYGKPEKIAPIPMGEFVCKWSDNNKLIYSSSYSDWGLMYYSRETKKSENVRYANGEMVKLDAPQTNIGIMENGMGVAYQEYSDSFFKKGLWYNPLRVISWNPEDEYSKHSDDVLINVDYPFDDNCGISFGR